MQNKWLIKWLETPLLSTIYYGQVLSCAPIWHCCILSCLSCDSFAFAHIPDPLSPECNKIVLKQQPHYWEHSSSSRTVSVIMMMMSGSGQLRTNHIYHLPNIVAPRHKPGAWADQSLGPVIKSLSDAGVTRSAETAAVFSITYLQTLVSGRRLQHLQPAVPSSSSRDKWTVLSSRDVLILWYRAHTAFCSINNALPTSCLFAPSKVIMCDFLSLL